MTVHNVLKAKVPRRRPPTISPEQASALVASTTNFRDRFIVTLLLESGLRVGEMLGLFIEDFRFDKQTGGCYVDVVFRGYHPNGGSAKTRDRSVPITQDLMEMFDDYIFDIREEVGRDHPFVMVKIAGSGAGEPLDYGSVRSAFRRYSERVGAHVTPHMLRHTYGTLLYAETKDLRLVQELLGHSSMKTTSELYVHPTSEDVYEGWSKAKQRLAVGTMANVRTAASDG